MYAIGTGLAVGLMATPVGWVGALLIGAGSLVAGVGGSIIAKELYDISGSKADFVALTGVNQVCVGPKSGARQRMNSIYSNHAIYSR